MFHQSKGKTVNFLMSTILGKMDTPSSPRINEDVNTVKVLNLIKYYAVISNSEVEMLEKLQDKLQSMKIKMDETKLKGMVTDFIQSSSK
jgi:hypothetical protein